MRVESIRLKNFRAFRDVHMKDIPSFCVLIGANGTGKSTLFSVFSFLRDAMMTNVTAALGKLGGFHEVRSRGCDGPIEIELKVQADLGRANLSQITYSLAVTEENGKPIVQREIVKCLSNHGGTDRCLIDFSRGIGQVVTNEIDLEKGELQVIRQAEKLNRADSLAIKGLSQFMRYPTIVALGTQIEQWCVSDYPLLCVESPERHIYPSLLEETVQQLRCRVASGGQVFVSTYSPSFLDAIELDAVFGLKKSNGYAVVTRARDDEQIAAYMADGDRVGRLWSQGLFDESVLS
jgi:predicted ATPase